MDQQLSFAKFVDLFRDEGEEKIMKYFKRMFLNLGIDDINSLTKEKVIENEQKRFLEKTMHKIYFSKNREMGLKSKHRDILEYTKQKLTDLHFHCSDVYITNNDYYGMQINWHITEKEDDSKEKE